MPHDLSFRPHHFLCALGFQGKGYSDVFTANMALHVGRLRGPGGGATMIAVTAQADDICAPCPLRRGTGCESQAKINRLDAAHAAALGIGPGDRLSWADAQVRMRQIAPEDLDTLCEGCRWLPLGLCQTALRSLRDNPETAS